ncbi:MAG TPA: DUF4815 domain-containing protein [Nitrolancea sp.]|nr:DUF4815 domain-containing protein [Nitrolancea sp.]
MWRTRILSLAATLAMVATLFAGAVSLAAAAPITDASVMTPLYFPWVPNGETLAGAGPWNGAVTIQNLEASSVVLGFNTTANTVVLNAHSSLQMSAAALHVAAPGGLLVATASWNSADLPAGICTPGGTGTQQQSATVGTTRGVANGADVISLPAGQTLTSVDAVTYGTTTYVVGTDYNVVQANDTTINIDWSLQGVGSKEPPTGATYSVKYTYTVQTTTAADCSRAPHVAGAEKQALPTALTDLTTTANAKTVDGYTAVTTDGLGKTIYLPIVQRNNNWESIIHVSNPNAAATTVTLDLTVAVNQSTGGNVTRSWTVGAGQTQTIDLASLVNSGWIGSAKLSAPDSITALVDRVKPSTNMALINVAEPMGSQTVYAPLVFRGYQNWKTGINLVDISGQSNKVTITYYRQDGTPLLSSNVTLPANGMNFVYVPEEAAAGENFLGSASLSGQGAFLVTLDEVKYTTTEAMSYLVTDTSQLPAAGDMLALPLIQKGDASGAGDTSGINLFNPADASIQFTVTYFDTTGKQVATFNGALAPHQGQTLYTLDQGNLPAGFQGSAVIAVTGGTGSLAAVSNNVNYAVAGDGSSVFSPLLITAPAP